MSERVKTIARTVLPSSLYRGARTVLHTAQPILDWLLGSGVGLHFALTFGVPSTLLVFGDAPGDNLLCTAVLREFRKRNRDKLAMISNFPELFEGSNDAMCVVPLRGSQYQSFAKIWGRDFRQVHYIIGSHEQGSIPPHRHIIAELCARAGITGLTAIRPYLFLTENERGKAAWANGNIAIQSSGLASSFPMHNKQWYPERFQAVVNALYNEFDFVQVGSAIDPKLDHVDDLRGTSIRESAAILHHSRLYVGTAGFVMHLARAVECPSVIIYGGREAPWQSGYICNANLYTPLACAPCWRWNTCDFDRKCMKDISVEDVVFQIREMINKRRNPLSVETVLI